MVTNRIAVFHVATGEYQGDIAISIRIFLAIPYHLCDHKSTFCFILCWTASDFQVASPVFQVLSQLLVFIPCQILDYKTMVQTGHF
jgi:hypothetical protein